MSHYTPQHMGYGKYSRKSPYSHAGIITHEMHGIHHMAEGTQLPSHPVSDVTVYGGPTAPVKGGLPTLLIVAAGVVVAGYFVVKGM